MMRQESVMTVRSICCLAGLALAACLALGVPGGEARAAGDAEPVPNTDFSFDGLGGYDDAQLRRGFQVYDQVCSSCHGMKYVPLRTLGDPGGPEFSPERVREIAGNYQVFDPELDDGLGGVRDAKPTDTFPESSYPGAPDMSVIAKARPHGADYIAALLQGYTGEDRFEAGTLLYENRYYEGGYLAMAPPLYGDDVVYADGTPATVAQQSEDVAAFLMWAAEPRLEARKRTGTVAVSILVLLTALLWLSNRKLWAPLKAEMKGDSGAP